MAAADNRATLTEARATAFTGRKWVRWTQRMKALFLDHLAATCNVRASAAAIGVDPVSVYNLRRNDAEFLVEWERALDCGYQLLETQLVGHALSGDADRRLTNGDPALPAIDVDTALRLLATRRNGWAGKNNRGGPPRRRATKAETDAAILKKLAAIEAAMRAEG